MKNRDASFPWLSRLKNVWIFHVEDYKLLVAVSPMVSRPSLVGFLQEFLDRFGTRIYAKFGQHQRV